MCSVAGSSGAHAQLLSEFLPLSGATISPAMVRRHTLAAGERLDHPVKPRWALHKPVVSRETRQLLEQVDKRHVILACSEIHAYLAGAIAA